jgi:hypothetical protein
MDEEASRSVRPLLEEHRANGEYLLHSARMVGDEEDHAIWRTGTRVWREEVAGSIALASSREKATSFRAASVAVPAGGWKPQYVAEVKIVKDAIALLAVLADEADAHNDAFDGQLDLSRGELVGA